MRRLADPGGEVIVERPVGFDEAERSYGCPIRQAPFPVELFTRVYADGLDAPHRAPAG
ncbi:MULTISPECIES: hypothetical protein [Kitasatospora]|uniref:Uncharacterized protein n=1 Tax=Kitasatospora setae (strain ATCC 33774 / DSM 43861 / JCM 3304 / KCC A-0304 / NBRC 14216 / KM-6054) TaxID=452652 RepID=E4NE58_KITSK|nr:MULTISPECIES: hypothetical protein [Kitasatospora]BAJ29489.1 hypothetical protein KSE_36870 [Kitasatospora setae KM-6054]